MSDGYQGAQQPESDASEFNAMLFMVRQVLNRANTATLVQIKAVTNNGGLSPVGFVDVVPLVAQVDGAGNATPHGIVYNLPYHRLQGGANAIILDPQIGDIGIAVFADHDISSVKTKKAAATPGSMRRFDMADGMYLGGFLNGVPNQYVQFTGNAINIVSPGTVHVTAPNVTVDAATATINASAALNITAPTVAIAGSVNINGNLGVTGTAINNGKNIGSTHTHSGVMAGVGNTGVPN